MDNSLRKEVQRHDNQLNSYINCQESEISLIQFHEYMSKLGFVESRTQKMIVIDLKNYDTKICNIMHLKDNIPFQLFRNNSPKVITYNNESIILHNMEKMCIERKLKLNGIIGLLCLEVENRQ